MARTKSAPTMPATHKPQPVQTWTGSHPSDAIMRGIQSSLFRIDLTSTFGSASSRLYCLQDTNTQLEDCDQFEAESLRQMIETIHTDSLLDSGFTACKRHQLYRSILTFWGRRAIAAILANIDSFPWVSVFLLEDITGEQPYPAAERLSIDDLVEAWKQWQQVRPLHPRR